MAIKLPETKTHRRTRLSMCVCVCEEATGNMTLTKEDEDGKRKKKNKIWTKLECMQGGENWECQQAVRQQDALNSAANFSLN